MTLLKHNLRITHITIGNINVNFVKPNLTHKKIISILNLMMIVMAMAMTTLVVVVQHAHKILQVVTRVQKQAQQAAVNDHHNLC